AAAARRSGRRGGAGRDATGRPSGWRGNAGAASSAALGGGRRDASTVPAAGPRAKRKGADRTTRPEARAKGSRFGPVIPQDGTRSDQLAHRVAVVEDVHRPAAAAEEGLRRVDADGVVEGGEQVGGAVL